ncbi:amino acid adenylation domain-containing protein, partial [Methylomonas sp. OY6]
MEGYVLSERHDLDGSADDAPSLEGATSLTDVLQRRAACHPHRIAYTVLDYGASGQHSLTYDELNAKARQLAASLQQVSMQGERALLLYPPGLDYIVAFFACLYAGVIAVPAYPPSNNRHMPRLQAILDDSKAKIILTTQQVANNIRHFSSATGDLLDKHCLQTDVAENSDDASSWQAPILKSIDLAFLQYTSGSTGDAKGVMISHGNLMANQQLIKRRFGHDERSTVVGWLPLYHDMGLIGNVMQPLYCGASAILMAPMAFLEKPLRWLQAISDYRAHTSGGPNFAYDLCVQKISPEELAGIDLGSWQLAFNGAEPINPLTLQRFSETFSACGFQRRAFYPCYGLAEATLLATGGAKQSLPRIAAFDKTALEQRVVHSTDDNQLNARSLVGCGAIDIDGGQGLRIVDPDNATCCPNGRIGEIWLSGPSIAQGYWQNPEMSDRAFVHDAQGHPWLRTGDLGFIDDGELFVSGRLKDLIIIRGRNYYPHDLEYAVEAATDALSPASTVAFSVDEGDGEKLIVLAELKRNRIRQGDFRNEFSAIRARLTEECGIQSDRILFLKPGAILKTSSGKLRRNACKALFLQQGFECIAVDAQRISDATSLPSAKANQSVNERHLLRQALLLMDRSHAADLLTEHLALKAAELSGVAAGTVEPTHTLSSLGLDSLKAVEMKYFIDELLTVDIPITSMLGSATLFDSAVTALSLVKTIDQETSSLINKDGQSSNTSMSYNQRALWTRARMESAEALYHMSIALQIQGELNCNALGRALSELHRRHDQLRCGFELDTNNESICAPLDQSMHELEQADCSDPVQRTETLRNFVNKPFDLRHGPLLRCGVFSCGANDHLLAFCAHHLIIDFRSLLVLQRELQTLYTGYARGVEAQLPEVKTNYSEYIVWQQSYLRSEAASRDKLYWQEQLAGELPQLILPGNFTAPCRQLRRGGAVGLTIETANLVRLKALASTHNVTLYTLVLTVFKALLYRYTAQHDLIVGTPTLGRPSSRFADLVGYCVNPVALRSKPSGELTFCDYLADVNAVVLGALEHQNYPQSLVLEKLRSEHRQSNIELYRTFFVLHDSSDSDVAALALGQAGISLRWAGLEARSSALPDTAEEFELAVLAAETRNGLTVTFRYCRSAWEREGIFRLLGHFQCLLLGMLAEPGARLSQLPLLTAPERLQQKDWNATEAAYPQDLCLHQLFEVQAKKTPDTVALNFEEQTLTYAELNARANQLAHYLIEQGVGPEVLVGICMERSLDMVIGLLGILKAGGAYVPLDPTYPEERLRYMLDDADIRLLLTRQNWAGLVVSAQRPTVYLDQDWPSINLCLDSNPGVRNLPLNLAYIIYTSGSTGQPKGVAVTHRNAVHSTFARFMQYPDQVKAYLLLSSFAFDSSVAGIFWTLGQGGCLCLPGENAGKDPAALAVLIQHQQVSHLLALPSLYAVLLEQATESLCSLKVAIVAGEACGIELVKQHFVSLPAVKLYNEYGPTEGTVWSSVYQAGLDDLDKPLSIGRPIANVRLYVLDRHLNPLPIGVAGELYIGGAGIVRGYLKLAELTAERFIPDPFQADGGRLYKTGDLARYRSDGALEFLGRIDHQVKIRGFRIELGEIEAQLLAHGKVKEAVVLAREDQPGDKKLVAYLVLSEPAVDQHDEVVNLLKVHLKQALPDYMVPSAFVILDEMPLSANGKLDRLRLPVPNWGGQSALLYEAPQNPIEMALTQIWQQLLAIERIGRHDNFFALGGDSILSIQVVSRARQAGIVITPKQLFERPTVFELAAIAETASHAVAEQGLVTGDVELTPIQHWFFERGLSNPHHWNQALMLRVKPELTSALFEAALHKLLVQHDALRMRFTNENGEWRQTNLTEEEQNVFKQVDLSHVPVAERDAVLQQQASDCQASLHLTHGPLLRAVWFDFGDNESHVVIAIHHLVVDGVSWRILLEDLNLACQQGLENQYLNLPAKTSSFQYWTKRLNQLTQNGGLNSSITYWLAPQRSQAATLPADYPHGANDLGLENEVAVSLSVEQTLTLLQEVPIAYRTLIDDVLLTALALTLRDWLVDEELSAASSSAQTATTILLIDRESHGREHLTDDLDISRTVGWFTSVYPLLLELPKGDDLARALKTVKEQIRAVPDHGISYGLLRYLSTDGELKQHLIAQPPAQIIFNYLGQLDTVLSEGALFNPSTDAAGLSHDPTGKRAHELDVVASIQGGRLHLSWRYSRERYRCSTLETLANRYLQHLQALISHCSQTEVGGYTPSDFPLAALSQSQLDILNLPLRQIDDIYPLAPLQHGLIFHSLYEPDSNVYRIQLACRLTGPLDTSIFKQAWQQLLERHAVLRSRFLIQDTEQLLQIVEQQASLPITEHDWRHESESERHVRWQALQATEHAQNFDFGQAPLMRLNLVNCGADEHYLLWSYHHILIDGWSMPLLVKEVFNIYHALLRGEPPQLAPIQSYHQYIAWLQAQDKQAAEAYWRQQLAGFEAATILGVDRAPGSKGWLGEIRKARLNLTDGVNQSLQRLAKQRHLTINTLAQAAWGLLLSHYSGNSDVVFGITVSGRPAELLGIENQVGLFINTLPLRLRIDPHQTVGECLQALFEQNQTLRHYEYASLAQVQTWSDIGRGQALFDSLLVFENYPIDQALMNIGGPIKIDRVVEREPTNYPLTLKVFPGDCLHMEIHYDDGRFPANTVGAMLEHLNQLLETFAEQPQLKLGQLPTLTENETQQILHNWNTTEAVYPQDFYLHQLFEAQAEKTPDAVALSFEEQNLTYTELNARANQLAHYLIEQGVGPEVLVGICMERS